MHNGKRVIALCSAKLNEQFNLKLLNRVIKELQYSGHYVLVFGLDSDLYYMSASDFGDVSIFNLMSYKTIDMVMIFTETMLNDEPIADILMGAGDAKIPVVSIGREISGCYNIVWDTASSFEQIVRHIVEYHGMREVNFIAGMKDNVISEKRLDIYRTVLDDNDILYEEDRVGYGDFWAGPTREVMERFMSPDKVPPEAIICANDSMAIAATDFLKERGVKVPEEILVTGIDGIEEGVLHYPGITTAIRDDVNDAKKIVMQVNTILDGGTVAALTELEYRICLSQSCGCQKTHIFDMNKILTNLNTEIAAYRFDLPHFREMQEAFLACEDDKKFQKVLEEYMPNEAFICINEDLHIKDGKENPHTYNEAAFTPKLRTVIKRDNKISYSECFLENMIPEAAKNETANNAVLLLPIHYIDRVVGFLGVWRETVLDSDMFRILHFLLAMDCSAALLLSQK